MNSTLNFFLTILVTAGVVGFGTYTFVNKGEEVSGNETEEEVTSTAISNTVKYLHSEPDFAFQFELPEGYGAIEDIEGEGTYTVKYYIGEFAPEAGKNVIQSSLSVADYVQIIPSYDPEIVTLEDWRKTGNVYDGADALETKSLTIAGITATASTFPAMGETWIVQFVEDKNYYEIHVDGTLEDEAVAKVIETFSFIE